MYKWKFDVTQYLPDLYDSQHMRELAHYHIYILAFCWDHDREVNVGECCHYMGVLNSLWTLNTMLQEGDAEKKQTSKQRFLLSKPTSTTI